MDRPVLVCLIWAALIIGWITDSQVLLAAAWLAVFVLGFGLILRNLRSR